ncbi:nucleotide exchange factor GrpE [Amycolatopsis anabasis]|uniref:nucleotide exchange factor GrpE n=1 Tax=Amycolatopsis anabasis TaxID=1840409 RepID=UPI0015D22C62|nr:nucleotide exchange factor GrpE [Amycolatopsis anabasis]
MAAWFRRDAPDENPDDEPTGQIPARVIAELAAETEAESEAGEPGTDPDTGASKPGVEPVPALAPAGPGSLEQALADRQALIQLCLYALDRARSGGVVERIEQGLAGIGVTALRPDGQRFDPARHEAGGAVETEDAALDGVVAETEVVGFAEGDRLLRAPIVTVYTLRASRLG